MKRVLLLTAGLLLTVGAGWSLMNLALGGVATAATAAAGLLGGVVALLGASATGGEGVPNTPPEDAGPEDAGPDEGEPAGDDGAPGEGGSGSGGGDGE